MVTKRTPVPSLSLTRDRPSDLLFRPATPPTTPPPDPPAAVPAVLHAKISLYLPSALLADVDAYRTAMLRERGLSLDRSRVMRELIREALHSPGLLERLLREEEP